MAGRRALVTGANTGIGQAIALAFCDAGVEVVGVGRSSMEETARAGRGGAFHPLAADLAEREAVSRLIGEAEARFGPLDILVNNAGIIRRGDAVELGEADWDDVLDLNLRAVFMLCQSFARSVLARGGRGRIVNIASLLSFQGGIRVASYTASKSAVVGLTRALANEWAQHGINVNAVAPGYVRTNNTAALQQDPERHRQILERIPAGRWGEPGDIAGPVLFLCSEAAGYVHGATLPADGGWLAR